LKASSPAPPQLRARSALVACRCRGAGAVGAGGGKRSSTQLERRERARLAGRSPGRLGLGAADAVAYHGRSGVSRRRSKCPSGSALQRRRRRRRPRDRGLPSFASGQCDRPRSLREGYDSPSGSLRRMDAQADNDRRCAGGAAQRGWGNQRGRRRIDGASVKLERLGSRPRRAASGDSQTRARPTPLAVDPVRSSARRERR